MTATQCLLIAGGTVACSIGLWRFASEVPKEDVLESDQAAAVLDEGRAICSDIARVVRPAMQRTRKAATDPIVIASLKSGNLKEQTASCNRVVTDSTEIDAFALFDKQGHITAINTLYADATPIAPEKVSKILGMSFDNREIIQGCVSNSADSDILEFQTTCDITPAFFDSTGLSIAYSVPVFDPTTGAKIGVASTRLRFERLSSLVEDRSDTANGKIVEFVTDKGGYFSESINGKLREAPIPPQVLQEVVTPLVGGGSNYSLARHEDDHIALFRLKEFSTLEGGGIQVLLAMSDERLGNEAAKLRRANAAWIIGGGLLAFLVAALIRSMQRVRAGERRARTLIDTALDAVVVTDANEAVTGWNPVAERLFGFTAQAMGKSLREQIGLVKSGQQGEFKLLDLAQSQVESGGTTECTARGVKGDDLIVEAAVARLHLDSRNVYSVFLRDVTARRRLEQQLAQSRRLESIGQLANGLAHEINTPTQYVSDNIRFLRDQITGIFKSIEACDAILQPVEQEIAWKERVNSVKASFEANNISFSKAEMPMAIDEALEGLTKITTIVRAMKDFSNPSVNKEMIDINRVVESTLTVCMHRWSNVAELQIVLDGSLPRVECVPSDINQVVLNLVANAADAIEERYKGSKKGVIKVSTRQDRDKVEILVEDNGTGMTDEVREQLFSHFFTTKGVGKGSGQGLCICRDTIVKRHAGSINYETTPGAGTKFIVSLPAQAASPGMVRKEAA